MGKWLPETCWADSKINKIIIVASSWSFILFTYIDDARSNTNQIKGLCHLSLTFCIVKVKANKNVRRFGDFFLFYLIRVRESDSTTLRLREKARLIRRRIFLKQSPWDCVSLSR